MQPRKLKVVFAFFPYGGNGNAASEHPDTRNWVVPTVLAANKDPRIEPIEWIEGKDYLDTADTPITMCRNEAFAWAKSVGADVLIAVDSDNKPDVMLGIDPLAKPFFQTSFNHLYANYERGPVVIGAPYCGPPMQPNGAGNENIYVFIWRNYNSDNPMEAFKLDQFTREEAAMRAGIEPVAALPTGCIMYDMRILECVDPPYFDYEFQGDGNNCSVCHQRKRGPMERKGSTEDVMFTRNISLNGCKRWGYNPVMCNWDAWAGHWKPKCVGKPRIITADTVGSHLRKALEQDIDGGKRTTHVHRSSKLPRHPDDGKPVERCVPKDEGQRDPESDVRWVAKQMLEPSNLGHCTFPNNILVLKGLVGERAKEVKHCEGIAIFVELGSWTGKSAVAIAEAARAVVGEDYEVHCYDRFDGHGDISPIMRKSIRPDEDNIYKTFKKNTEGFQIHPHRNDTVQGAKSWAFGRQIDLLFVDADHSYEGVKADLEAWLPFVVEGGMVCGDDFGNIEYPGVEKAVREIFPNAESDGLVWWARNFTRSTAQVAVNEQERKRAA